MVKNLIFIALLLISCIVSFVVVAEDDPEWLADKARLEKLVDEKDRCVEQWNILWKWAKKGSMEARSIIFFLMAPPSDMKPIYAPGNKGDIVTTKRDMLIFLVHSYDSGVYRKYYGENVYEIFELGGFGRTSGGQEFMKCIRDAKSQNCADVAVKERLVPSFIDYASQIDALMAQGMVSTCQ